MTLTDRYFSQPHICQSPEWGEFKTKMGTPAVKVDDAQFTLHPIPATPFKVGYCPKVDPKKIDWEKLFAAGKKHNCLFIKVEPNALEENYQLSTTNYQLQKAKALFRHHTFLLDLKKSEEEILASMHPKTRYNINLAQRRGVRIEEHSDPESLEIFIRLQKETARRDGFSVHPDDYYRVLFQTLRPYGMVHLLIASLGTWPDSIPLAADLFFKYKKVFYYPFGGSASHHRELMAPYLLIWEGIKLGKSLGCEVFDFWGAAPPKAPPSDPWYGLTRFKKGFGGEWVEFADTYDLVISPILYQVFLTADRMRWFFLRLRTRI